MDTKDKAIIWVLYLIVAMIIHLNLYAVITGAIIIGIAIKIIDANFATLQVRDYVPCILHAFGHFCERQNPYNHNRIAH